MVIANMHYSWSITRVSNSTRIIYTFSNPELSERTRQSTARVGELVGDAKLCHVYSEQPIQKRDVSIGLSTVF
jgi:hypothetical protein